MTYLPNDGVAPRILNLGTKYRWMLISRPSRFIPWGKSPRYLMDRKLDWPQICSGRGGEETLPLPGIEPRSSSP
jgi:hypothetical protein